MHNSYLVDRLSKDEEVGLNGRQNCAREASEGLWGPWESPTGQSPPGTQASTGPRPYFSLLADEGEELEDAHNLVGRIKYLYMVARMLQAILRQK